MKVDITSQVLPANQMMQPSAEEHAKLGGGQQPSIEKQKAAEEKTSLPREEILGRIRDLTEGGSYSVRFETDKETEDLIVKIVNAEDGELIRQLPPEEILDMTKKLNELRGSLVSTQG